MVSNSSHKVNQVMKQKQNVTLIKIINCILPLSYLKISQLKKFPLLYNLLRQRIHMDMTKYQPKYSKLALTT